MISKSHEIISVIVPCFNSGKTLRRAIESIKNGIETNIIYQHIYENSSRERMQLLGDLLSNLNYELNVM